MAYVCLVDGKSFEKAEALQEHNKDSHYLFKLECGKCKNCFRYAGHYKAHVAECNFKSPRRARQPAVSRKKAHHEIDEELKDYNQARQEEDDEESKEEAVVERADDESEEEADEEREEEADDEY